MKRITGILAVLTLVSVGGERPSSELNTLYKERRWAELNRALESRQAPALYRGATATVFNDANRAERILQSVIRSAPYSDGAYQAYEWLAHLYLRAGLYRRFMANMEARWAAFPTKSELKDEQNATAGFRGLPDQTAGEASPFTLKHEPGEIFIPISINGRPATYFFDTGAWVNCMSESEARRIGLAIHDAEGTLATGTGARVGFRTAVARELTVGKLRFQNVSFAIFRDDQEPWSDLPAGRRGLIGIPIILGFRAFEWRRDGTMTLRMKTAKFDPARSNLLFDDDHLVLTALLGDQHVLATLDTGAQTTDLYKALADQFGSLLAGGKTDRTEVRGVGNAESFDSIMIPELAFRIGDFDATLHWAHVLLKQIGAKCCIGNFGLDLLKQARGFKIDFAAMRLELQAN
jgi:predicted aspartyl protease